MKNELKGAKMKNENSYKSLFIPWVISILVIVGLMLLFSSKSQLISNITQAVALVTLVFITWFYARQTQKQAKFSKGLLDEQKLKRGLEFNERRLRDFYNPFHKQLGEATKNFHEKSIEETKNFLEEPEHKIFWPYYFMVPKETREIIKRFFLKLAIEAFHEHNDGPGRNSKSKLLESLNEMSEKLHEEREIIENYISDNYPFPEKEIKKEVNHGNL